MKTIDTKGVKNWLDDTEALLPHSVHKDKEFVGDFGAMDGKRIY
jgi:hypothetical protein